MDEENSESQVWMLNARGRPQLLDSKKVEPMKERGYSVFPISKLVNGRPPQTYYPQYDSSNPTRETLIISDDEKGDLLKVEII